MKNDIKNWSNEALFPVTICDQNGLIVYMNKESIKQFASDGGENLIGKSLLDCHPEPSRSKLVNMLAAQTANTYISRSNDQAQLVHETPWFENGEYKGFIEISIDVTNLGMTK